MKRADWAANTSIFSRAAPNCWEAFTLPVWGKISDDLNLKESGSSRKFLVDGMEGKYDKVTGT